MKKEEWIEGVRSFLDEPSTHHLLTKAEKTEDIEELRELLNRAKTTYESFIHDVDFLLDYAKIEN